MRVVCWTGVREMFVAEFYPDEETIAKAEADEYNKGRPGGPCVSWSEIPHIIEVTQGEIDEHEALITRLHELVGKFNERIRANTEALKASKIYPR